MKTYIYILIALFVFIGCKETDKKEYFVRPIEVVCDYPFNDTTKWAITCRVWGLLKYYHPNVTAGKLDWDKVLLNRLDKINDAQTPEQVNAELMSMIRDAGKYKGTVDKNWDDSLNMNVNICWLDHSFINDTLRQELRKIASLEVKQPSYYVGYQDPKIVESALVFDNEKDYSLSYYLDYKYRMLALFRYWNIYYYFFAYKYLMDQSWDITLEEFIPVFMDAYNFEKYREAVMRLSTRVNDGHAFTSITPEKDWRNPYDRFYNNVVAMIDTDRVIRIPPESSLLERGDVIKSINGKSVKDFTDSIATIYPSSHRHYLNGVVNVLIGKTIMDGCELTLLRGDKELTIRENKIEQAFLTEPQPFYMISSEIGYVYLGLLMTTAELTNIMEKIEHVPAVIFDLRNYPMPSNTLSICFLTSDPQLSFGTSYIQDLSHCGSYFFVDQFGDCPPDNVIDCSRKYKGKIVVLTYSLTMSFPENLAMLFRNYGATLIGTPTAGAHGNIASLPMPGKITASMSSVGYVGGGGVQRKGVIPDIEVYPTMESIMEGKDEILEEAIRYINSLK